ncbi:hypothetical protein MLD38_023369 [Melastoma candidum]|uniref:Uncharacterized protein n=1 Tax=Melastoma candidum TaxID=119954 RepID=A0ACB9QVG7_9MYRT|nr:hypothetical protein MLD38_023369 [Melastoma candidum]
MNGRDADLPPPMNGDADFGRKRKNRLLNAINARGGDDCEPDPDDELTNLSLSHRISRQRLPSQPPPPLSLHASLELYSLQPQPQQVAVLEVNPVPSTVPPVAPQVVAAAAAAATGGRGRRRAANNSAAQNRTIVPPYPWATDRRATVHSYESLLSRRILVIEGTVQCKKCEKSFEIEYDLKEKFLEIGRYIADNKASMRDRAPAVWMNPVLPRCKLCNQDNSAKPVFPQDKDGINWLFLLLGQMIGCCTLDQLKYFCEHTKNHRTGAKDRIVYYTYLGLCKQLDPTGPFDP